MELTPIGSKIEKLGRDMAEWDRRSLEAYREGDYDQARTCHQKAAELEELIERTLEAERSPTDLRTYGSSLPVSAS